MMQSIKQNSILDLSLSKVMENIRCALMPKKTRRGMTEAALAILLSNGFTVSKSLYIGGFAGIDEVAAGTFLAGVFIIIQRYRDKQDAK